MNNRTLTNFADFEEVDSDLYVPRGRDARSHRDRQPASPRFRDAHDPAATAGEPVGPRQQTYVPARYEAVWLEASLRSFYEQELIVDVLANIRGGKEANVYRCAADSGTGESLLAAKVYRPRRFRNLSNDRAYREGRELQTFEGVERKWGRRVQTAIAKKTRFSVTSLHTSWLMYEYTALERLHQAGAAVPLPLAANENAILMAFIGDEHTAAPTLREVTLGRADAARAFDEVIRTVELMAAAGWVHGDLSAYNVLWWQGKATLIDFPQVVIADRNPNAYWMLDRDLTRICEYFGRCGVRADPHALAAEVWRRHFGARPGTASGTLDRLL